MDVIRDIAPSLPTSGGGQSTRQTRIYVPCAGSEIRQFRAASPKFREPCYLSVRQVAARIPYAEQTIRNLMHSGELVDGQHYFKRRGRVIFSWPAMRAWVEQQGGGHEGEDTLPLVRNRRNGRPQ